MIYSVIPEDPAADILKAGVDILGADFEHGFKTLARVWHPDVNKDPRASDVLTHLTKLRRRARGEETEPAEHIAVAGGELVWREKLVVLDSASMDVAAVAGGLTALSSAHPDLAKRLPKALDRTKSQLAFERPTGAVSMPHVLSRFPTGLPAHHVAWMASRLYELVYTLKGAANMMWGGLAVESLMVLVEPHGVIPLDPRFVLSLGSKMTAAPTALVPFVPADKLASSSFDLACVNRIALILLGDPSGTGNALLLKAKKGEIDQRFLDWFRKPPGSSTRKNYDDYRALLKLIWGPGKYHKLEV